jgi:hypothetical protein
VKISLKAIFGDGLVNHANNSRLKAYFNLYCCVRFATPSEEAVIVFDTPASESHPDGLRWIEIIVHDPKISFDAFTIKAIGSKAYRIDLEGRRICSDSGGAGSLAVNGALEDYYIDNFK